VKSEWPSAEHEAPSTKHQAPRVRAEDTAPAPAPDGQDGGRELAVADMYILRSAGDLPRDGTSEQDMVSAEPSSSGVIAPRSCACRDSVLMLCVGRVLHAQGARKGRAE
jgi:hypothetical protein